MAKDPAFLFYYDRFLSGTFTMTDEQVGQYIRLMCIQANKGHVTDKDLLNICKTYDEDIACKFQSIGDGKYVNKTLSEVIDQRKAFTESRRNNRKGKNATNEKEVNNICVTHDAHMVNVNVNKEVEVNKEEVQRIFLQQGGTMEMAEQFYNKHSSTGWVINGNPIKKLAPAISNYIINWKNNQNGKPIQAVRRIIADPSAPGTSRAAM